MIVVAQLDSDKVLDVAAPHPAAKSHDVTLSPNVMAVIVLPAVVGPNWQEIFCVIDDVPVESTATLQWA